MSDETKSGLATQPPIPEPEPLCISNAYLGADGASKDAQAICEAVYALARETRNTGSHIIWNTAIECALSAVRGTCTKEEVIRRLEELRR